MIGVGSEVVIKDTRDMLVALEANETAPADSNTSDTAPKRWRVAVDDNDPSFFDTETFG